MSNRYFWKANDIPGAVVIRHPAISGAVSAGFHPRNADIAEPAAGAGAPRGAGVGRAPSPSPTRTSDIIIGLCKSRALCENEIPRYGKMKTFGGFPQRAGSQSFPTSIFPVNL